MRILNWNVQWARPDQPRGRLVEQTLLSAQPEIACLTEIGRPLLRPQGHAVFSEEDYGYRRIEGQRKVQLWSRDQWTRIDTVGHPSLPHGRFASGITQGVRFVGVCAPGVDAHVHMGRRDRLRWEEHILFWVTLKEVLKQLVARPEPLILLGDFNQQVPHRRQPIRVYRSLLDALPDGYYICSACLKDASSRYLVDHVAVPENAKVYIQSILQRRTETGEAQR